MPVPLWRLILTLLTVVVALVATSPEIAHAADLDRTAEHGELGDSAETSGESADDCEPVPPPHDAGGVWALAVCPPCQIPPYDVDPSSDRPPPRS